MSTDEFLTQARPAEVLREAILRHVRYTLVRPTSELNPADYLKPVSLAIRDRIVDRMLETESRYRHKDPEAPLLPLDGIPDGPLAGRQPVEPARRRAVPRGAGRLRRQPGRGAGQRDRCRPGQRRPGTAGRLLPGIAWRPWACRASATASITNTACSGRRSSTASSARSPTAGRPTALPSRSSIPKRRSSFRSTAGSKPSATIEDNLEQSWTDYKIVVGIPDRHADRRLPGPDGELAAPVHRPRLGRFRHRDLQSRRLHPRRRAEDRSRKTFRACCIPPTR